MSRKIKLFLAGRLIEASSVSGPDWPEGSSWRVQIISAGLSENGNDYPLNVIHEAAPLFEGTKVLTRSDADHVRNQDTAAENVIGWIQDVEPNPEGLEGTLVLHGGGKSKGIREGLLNSWKMGKKTGLIGLSIVADGIASKVRKKGDRLIRAVAKFMRVDSVDVIVNPAAGGRFLRMVAGSHPEDKESKKLMDLTKLLALIEAHDPAGYKTIDQNDIDEKLVIELATKVSEALVEKATKAEEKLAKLTEAEEAKKKAAAAAGGAGDGGEGGEGGSKEVAELRGLVVSLTEAVQGLTEVSSGDSQALKELQAMRFETRFDTFFAESGLPDDAREHILARIPASERTEKDEKKLTEAITAERKYFFAREGFDGIPSAFIEGHSIIDESEKFVAAMTGLMTGQDEPVNIKDPKRTVPRATSLRESYVYFTGDTKVTGRMPRNTRRIPLYEAAATLNAQWQYVLGDSITRAMLRYYREAALDDWRKISDVVPVGDFRTQHRTQVGGFPVLSTVAAGADYVGFTDVPDDFEATYSVAKKGNTQDVTIEMISNDDVGSLKRLPRMMSRTAHRTLSDLVFTLITSNANLTLSGDTTALFTTAHGNTTSSFVAMSHAAIVAARIAMMRQKAITPASGGADMMIGPKYVLAAVDLEDTMHELIYSSGKPTLLGTDSNLTAGSENAMTSDNAARPNFLRRIGIEPITIPNQVDSNDWFMCADPMDIPTVEVGFLGGQEEPELFVQDMPNVGSMFTADKLTYKIRHIYGALIPDFRGWYGQLN